MRSTRTRDPRLLRWLRRSYVTLAIVAGVVILIRLVLDPVATHYTRKALDESDAVRGEFRTVHVTVFPPGYQISHIKIIERHGGDWKNPLFYAQRVAVGLDWRELLHGRVAAHARLDRPKIIVVKRTEGKETKGGLPDVGDALSRMTPLRIDRVDVRGGELVFRDLTAPRQPELWLHDLRLQVANIATRRNLARGRRATVEARAELGHSGGVSLAATADPFAQALDFDGKAEVVGWKVAELYDLIEPATELQTPEGTLDVFAEFHAARSAINGGVKPVLKNVKVRPTDEGIGNNLKAWLADKGLHLFSEKKPEGHEVATVVPIKGKLDDPKLQLWPALVGVIRNAFVEGVSAGFADLPPPTAGKQQSKFEQLKKGLKKKEGPPKAQPTPTETDKG